VRLPVRCAGDPQIGSPTHFASPSAVPREAQGEVEGIALYCRCMSVVSTSPAGGAWFRDDVMQLREWRTNLVHRLPPVPVRECTIGSAPTCSIRLADDSNQVSRLHARLVPDHGRWRLLDTGSTNGILVEGHQSPDVLLQPGVEVRLGGVTLIAESAAVLELRSFLCRLLGWSIAAQESVNVALRTLRQVNAGDAPLLLCGDGDLSEVALGLHTRSPRRQHPFVFCHPKQKSAPRSPRHPARHPAVEPGATRALAAAGRGTVCFRSSKLPADFSVLSLSRRSQPTQVQIIICASGLDEASAFRAAAIPIPPLRLRHGELGRIIDEYASDACSWIEGASKFALPPEDRQWIADYAADSIPEIEKGASRLIALRVAGSVLGAASLLGIHHSSLLRWIARRELPIPTERLLGYVTQK
jgi:pSer/pThr/pTyr-binding forkhead associated (FHA) protein